jgi:hypothetical protein
VAAAGCDGTAGGGAAWDVPLAKSHVHVAVPAAPLGGFIGPRRPSNGTVLDPFMRVVVVAPSPAGNVHCWTSSTTWRDRALPLTVVVSVPAKAALAGP